MNVQSIVLTLIGAATAVFAGLPYGWAQAAATGLGAFFAAYNIKDVGTKTAPVLVEVPAPAPAAPAAFEPQEEEKP